MAMFQSFIGNSIYGMGFPVVIVAVDKPMDGVRTAEFFIMFLGASTSVPVNRRRFVYRNVPESMLSDDDLLKGTLHTVQAELDIALDTRRQHLGSTDQLMLPYSLRFNLEELHLQTLRFLVIHYRLRERVEQIRRETYCEDLRKSLPQCSRLNPWIVEEDQTP
jgi:hypothetical protein